MARDRAGHAIRRLPLFIDDLTGCGKNPCGIDSDLIRQNRCGCEDFDGCV